jgi:hypothetical protein
MEFIGILMLFGFLGMAFWVLFFLIGVLPVWMGLGLRDMFRNFTGRNDEN